MEVLISNFSAIMIVGILAIVVISNIHRIVGSALGMVFWIGVAIVGTEILNRGHELRLLSWPLSKTALYLLAGGIAAINAVIVVRALTKPKPPASSDD